METFVLAALLGLAGYTLKSRAERRRIGLLAGHLADYDLEKLMQTLSEGYLRALGEDDAARRASIWQLLETSEDKLCAQFQRFAAAFAREDGQLTQVSRLAWPLNEAAKLLPANVVTGFDLRRAFAVHAQGLARATERHPGQSAQSRAFTLSAEMMLMQHTCHWFCKSRGVASARLMVRHQTPFATLLASVSPETRRAYGALTGELSRKA
jgi:hypothetical protein